MENGNKKNDTRYTLITGGLLVMVIALLAVLWVRERRDRVFYYQQSAQLEINCKQMQETIQSLALQQISRDKPIQENEIVSVHNDVEIGGKKTRVLVVTPDAGKRLGIEPGKTISVQSIRNE